MPSRSGTRYLFTARNGGRFTAITNFPSGALFQVDVAGQLQGVYSNGQSLNFNGWPGGGVQNFSINPVGPDAPGQYPVQLTFDTLTADFEAHILSPPQPVMLLRRVSAGGAISVAPTNVVELGETVLLEAIAVGGCTNTYEWRREGEPIPRATNSTLTLPSVAVTQLGSYSVIISNELGVIESEPLSLAPLRYTVTATVSGGGGRVVRSPDAPDYDPGALVTLTPVPAPGMAFWRWTGAITNAANPLVVNLTSNITLTALFLPYEFVVISNPDFEANYDGGLYGPILGWSQNPAGQGGVNGETGPFQDNGVIPSGSRVAFYQGNGALSQTISGLTPGATYWLQFHYNTRAGSRTAGALLDLAVRFGGATLTNVVDIRPVGGSASYYFAQVAFIPTNGTGLLEFATTATGDVTLLLDAVNLGVTHLTPIPGLFGTGVSEDGTLLPDGAIDSHYRLVLSPDGSYPGPAAVVVNQSWPVAPAGPWLANGPRSKWIAPRPEQGTGNPPGLYTYRTSFTLPELSLLSARITGNWAVDDRVTQLRLNGVVTGLTNETGFVGFGNFVITNGFVSGTNTLDFVVENGPSVVNPTGLRIELLGWAEARGTNAPPQAALRFGPDPSALNLVLASTAGGLCRIEVSTNLLNWTSWPTNLLFNAGETSVRLPTTNAPAAFYRVFVLP